MLDLLKVKKIKAKMLTPLHLKPKQARVNTVPTKKDWQDTKMTFSEKKMC